jgi:Cu-Zn family superoxide dismutase
MKAQWICALVLSSTWAAAAVHAAELRATMNTVSEAGVGQSAGTVTVSESKYGLVFTPALTGLPPGVHGFHVHENGSCATNEKDGKPVPAGAAGAHLDTGKSKKHGLPWGDGHIGDLPALYVGSSGAANNPVLAPRLKKLADVKGKALMVHAGGDNHADHPAPLGGGGARIMCGIIE